MVNGDIVTNVYVTDTCADIDIDIGNGEYKVMVVANNDIGPSIGNPFVDIGMYNMVSSVVELNILL